MIYIQETKKRKKGTITKTILIYKFQVKNI